MTRSKIIARCSLWVVLCLFLVGFTMACAVGPYSYYDPETGNYYYSYDRCRTVHRQVVENGVVVRESDRMVCADNGPYYSPY